MERSADLPAALVLPILKESDPESPASQMSFCEAKKTAVPILSSSFPKPLSQSHTLTPSLIASSTFLPTLSVSALMSASVGAW